MVRIIIIQKKLKEKKKRVYLIGGLIPLHAVDRAKTN